MAERLPLLGCAVSDERACELEEAAQVGLHVFLSLRAAPLVGGPHRLDVVTPTRALRFLVEPLGPAGERGFPLRVYPWEESAAETTAAVAADPFVGRALAGGRFEIVSPIGQGSIGAVYRARHTGLGIQVAVKVLHEAFQRDIEFCRRFYAEALALSRLDHSNLVHIYDFGQEADGLLYIAMAYVHGQTLRTIMAVERKSLALKRMVSVMLQVSAGLGHAHARGLLHRDVKPDNVMVVRKEDDDGYDVETVKVLDFGFAIPPSVSADVAQRLAGTPVYMSPEQCLGEELDVRSDVYACGIMMYELMTGTVPFLGRSTEEIREKQVSEPAPPIARTIPDVDPRLDRLVQKALSKSRAQRQPNMQELRAELKQLLVAEGAVTRPRTPGSFDRVSAPPVSVIPSQRPSIGPRLEEAPTSTRGRAVADALAQDANAWVSAFAQERDPQALAARLAELDRAIRILAQRADVRTLEALGTILAGLADRLARAGDDGRARATAGALHLLRDPEILAAVAACIFAADREARVVAARLIREAGVPGAYALYGARTKIGAADQDARVAFVTTMKALGASALPVVRAALERIHPGAVAGENRALVDLAEDLLLSTPVTNDEVAGHLIVKYAYAPAATIGRASARALPRVWGDRARPTLLDLVAHPEDSVRIAALVGLQEIGGVDREAVRRIAALFDGRHAPSQALRAAVLGALQAATLSAQAEASQLMARVIVA